MITLDFFTFFYFFIFIFLYFELFSILIYSNNKFFFKKWYLFFKFKSRSVFDISFIKAILIYLYFFFFTDKLFYLNTDIMNALFLFNGIIFYFIIKLKSQFIGIVQIFIFLISFCLNWINDIFAFYLLLECYSYFFLFFFLNNFFFIQNFNKISNKSGIILFLINNFLTSSIFLMFINYIVYSVGTLNFQELLYINYNFSTKGLSLFYFIFLFKLNLPGFHFLKIELYNYLNLNTLVYFSVSTIYIYFILSFFLYSNLLFYCQVNFFFIWVIYVLCLYFITFKLIISNFKMYIAYSGFFVTTILSFLFIT